MLVTTSFISPSFLVFPSRLFSCPFKRFIFRNHSENNNKKIINLLCLHSHCNLNLKKPMIFTKHLTFCLDISLDKLHVDSVLGKHFVCFSDSRSCFILGHFTHLENNTCVVILYIIHS
jgi:hypothetical protein